VSSAEKKGVNAFSSGSLFSLDVTSTVEGVEGNRGKEGSLAAYDSTGLFGDEHPSHWLANAYLATRTSDGWLTRNLSPPTVGPVPATPNGTPTYIFSPDLSRMVTSVPWQALNGGQPLLYNLFLYEQGSYSLLTTAAPKIAVPPTCIIRCFENQDVSNFAGTSEDYLHVLFDANEGLTGTAAPVGGAENLYESYAPDISKPRQVRFLGILPDGTPAEQSVAGAGQGNDRFAISADGSHVVFSANADEGGPASDQHGMTEVYDRIGDKETVELSAPSGEGKAPANPAPELALFRAVSHDGSRVFFTSSAELTERSNTGVSNAGEDLYEYNNAVETGRLTDLSVDTNSSDAVTGADVMGVVGASEDGTYIYFVAKGKLAAGATDGQPNLYVSHEEIITGKPTFSLHFIATLDEKDEEDWASNPVESSAYLTPDGHHLALTSIDELTGYNNLDINTGLSDSEVFEYSTEVGSLVCVSCDPSGIRPVSRAFIGSTPTGARIGNVFHRPRVVSDDGALVFFSSSNHLQTNQTEPGSVWVFEHERDGSGSCTRPSGCIFAISHFALESEDVFLDASPSGHDVFFTTYDQLAPTDHDDLLDIYDARVDGGFPSTTAPTSSSSCSLNGECQSPGGAPSLPTSASEAFTGAITAFAPTIHTPSKHKLEKHRKTKKPKARRKHGHRARRP
jgi:hypothetical protein